MKVNVYSDGAARGNPGPAGIGVVIKEGHNTLLKVSDYIGKATNNVAEYMAFIRGLEEALLLGATDIHCYLDSELIVKQFKGEYKVKNEGLIPLHHHAKALIRKFEDFTISHTARKENKQADELANQGIDEHYKNSSPLFSS